MSVLAEAFQLIKDERWKPHWQLVNRYYNIQSWCIEDALQQVTSGLQFGTAAYMLAYDRLSDMLGEDVLEWERQPGRTQKDVEDLFERVLGGE